MNGDAVQSVLLALPVATAGVMLAMAAGMLRPQRPMVRWTGVAFMQSVAAYALKLWNDQGHVLPEALVFLRIVIGAGAVGWFWLFVTAPFEDEPGLSNPDEASVAVSAIAFELGIGSLRPFNWAFRQETGSSPFEWRRSALGMPQEPGEEAAQPEPAMRLLR
jgi:AraC-like DNA-binding protein